MGKRHYLPFKRARAAARKLKLKSQKAWQEWSNSGKRPLNIPGNPWRVYRDSGWISIADWLGYEPYQERRKARTVPSNRVVAGHGKKRKRSDAKPSAVSVAVMLSIGDGEQEEEEEEESSECSICLDPIPSNAKRTLRCSHSFCSSCIKSVAKKAAEEGSCERASRLGVMISCPMCRARVRI